MEYSEIVLMAEKLGISGMNAQELIKYEPQSDGLSGGVSKLYGLLGRLISCHKAGVAHDWLYERGGTAHDRLMADRLFCYSAAMSGKFIPGWLETWFNQQGGKLPVRIVISLRNTAVWWIPFAQLGWCVVRALIMYSAVRVFGGSRKHWNQKD